MFSVVNILRPSGLKLICYGTCDQQKNYVYLEL